MKRKSLCQTRGARVWILAALLMTFSGALLAQTGATVSARAGQRPPQKLPPPEQDGIHLSLDQAIRSALANNQDLNVTVNSAEAAQFFLFQNTGIYDPLLSANATRAHNDFPASTSLSGTTTVARSDTVDAGVHVSQLTPWGGTYSLGFVGARTVTNSR